MNFSQKTYHFMPKKRIFSKEFYNKIGSNWLLDTFYMFLLTPTALIGFILSLISVYVFCKVKIRQTKLYHYLRFYTLNSAVMSLLCCFAFTTMSPSYFPYFLSSFSKIYRCILLISPYTTLYFIGNMLDLMIALDRLSIFIKKLRIITQHSPTKITSSIIVGCVIINSPVFFMFYPKSNKQLYYEANSNIKELTYCGKNSFFNTDIGVLIILTVIILRDLITVIFEIIIVIWAIGYYRNYSKNDILSEHLKRKASISSIKREERYKQLLLMSIYLCIMSTINHSIVCFSSVLSLFYKPSSIFFNLLFISTLSLCIKYISNFFIFYYLNSNFKRCLFNIFFKQTN